MKPLACVGWLGSGATLMVVALSAAPGALAQTLPSGAVRLADVTAAERPAPAPTPRERDRVQMPLALEGLSDSVARQTLRVTSGAGRITASAAGVPALDLPARGRVILSSEPGKQSAEKSALSTEQKTLLPWLLVETTPAERGGRAPKVRAARPFLQLASAVLWNPQAKQHVAELLFGMDREGGHNGDDALSPPMAARFSVSCDGVQPRDVSIDRLGPAGYKLLRVACSPAVKNERESHFVAVHVDDGTLRYPFEIPRRPGPVVLLASSASMLGFGFGTTVLSVTQLEEDGSPLRRSEPSTVQLMVRGGSIDTTTLQLGPGNDSAQVEVHAPGTGTLEIEATLDGVVSAPVVLEVRWPFVPTFAMLLGGTLGGFLSAFTRRRSERNAVRRVVEGTLVGLLVTGFVLLLPTFAALPAWARSTELGLFVLAALAGFAGTPLLDLAAKKMFPALRPQG